MAVDTGQGHRVEGITLSSGIPMTLFCHRSVSSTFALYSIPLPLAPSPSISLPLPLSPPLSPDAQFSLNPPLKTNYSLSSSPPSLPPHNVKHCILTHDQTQLQTHTHSNAHTLTLRTALLSPSNLLSLSLTRSHSRIFQWWLLSLSSPGKQRILVRTGQREGEGWIAGWRGRDPDLECRTNHFTREEIHQYYCQYN